MPSSEIGTRFSGTAILILQSRFDHEWPEIARMIPPDPLKIIKRWETSRVAIYGQIFDNFRSFNCAFVQGDWVSVVKGEGLLTIVLKIVDVVVNGELGIRMTLKWVADFAASNICEALGARYVATARKLQIAPRLETLEKYEFMAGDLLA